MFFISNPSLRKLESFMQEVPNFPPKGVKVDLDKLEDEILLFEIENVIVNLKQHKEKERIMKFRNDQHRRLIDSETYDKENIEMLIIKCAQLKYKAISEVNQQ